MFSTSPPMSNYWVFLLIFGNAKKVQTDSFVSANACGWMADGWWLPRTNNVCLCPQFLLLFSSFQYLKFWNWKKKQFSRNKHLTPVFIEMKNQLNTESNGIESNGIQGNESKHYNKSVASVDEFYIRVWLKF